jgi:hypothetical protein
MSGGVKYPETLLISPFIAHPHNCLPSPRRGHCDDKVTPWPELKPVDLRRGPGSKPGLCFSFPMDPRRRKEGEPPLDYYPRTILACEIQSCPIGLDHDCRFFLDSRILLKLGFMILVNCFFVIAQARVY